MAMLCESESDVILKTETELLEVSSLCERTLAIYAFLMSYCTRKKIYCKCYVVQGCLFGAKVHFFGISDV